MDASTNYRRPTREIVPGYISRAAVRTQAGEIHARLSEEGNWELRVRRDQEAGWRLACTGSLDSGIIATQPVDIGGEESMTRGAVMVEPAPRRVTVKGTEVRLSRKEFGLLLVLATDPDRVFSRAELLTSIWGHPDLGKETTLRSHASKLRNRLRKAGAPGFIANCWGVGYRLWDRPDLLSHPPLTPAGEVG
jgi:DNA-binding response OmpR family regulator